MEKSIIHNDSEFAFEHKMIPDLFLVELPVENEYKGSMYPFHVVNAANFKNKHYSELKAQGVVNYAPIDKRADGIFDLIFNQKDEELTFLFETQPSLTKLVMGNIDQNLIIDHCPEKAEGQYILIPYTLGIFDNMEKEKTYFRLIPALPMLPEEKSLELTLMYEKRLEINVKMARAGTKLENFSYSLTPDVKKIKKKREKMQAKGSSLDDRIANELLANQQALLAGQAEVVTNTNVLTEVNLGQYINGQVRFNKVRQSGEQIMVGEMYNIELIADSALQYTINGLLVNPQPVDATLGGRRVQFEKMDNGFLFTPEKSIKFDPGKNNIGSIDMWGPEGKGSVQHPSMMIDASVIYKGKEFPVTAVISSLEVFRDSKGKKLMDYAMKAFKFALNYKSSIRSFLDDKINS